MPATEAYELLTRISCKVQTNANCFCAKKKKKTNNNNTTEHVCNVLTTIYGGTSFNASPHNNNNHETNAHTTSYTHTKNKNEKKTKTPLRLRGSASCP